MLKKTARILWRSSCHLLVAVLLLLFIIWGVLVILAHSANGSRWLLEKIAQQQKLVRYQVVSGNLIDGVFLKNFRFTGKTFYLDAQELHLDIVWMGLFRKELFVETLHGKGVQLVLHGQPNPHRTKLKHLNLPIRLVLNEGVLTDAQINKRGMITPINRLALHYARWKGETLELSELEFVHPKFSTVLQGQLAFKDDYPLQAIGTISAEFWKKQTLKPIKIKAIGNLGSLGVDLISKPVAVSGVVDVLEPTLDYVANLRWGYWQFPWLSSQNFVSRYGQVSVRGDKKHLELSVNTDLQSSLLPRGEYRAFAETDWHSIDFLPLEARTVLGGKLAIQGKVSWPKDKGIQWQLASDWLNVDLSKKWPVLQKYLPSLTGKLHSEGLASAQQSKVTADAQWINGEQWQIKQQNKDWFWHWQQPQQLQASWKHINRSWLQLNSEQGHLTYQGHPNAYALNLDAAFATEKTPQGTWQIQGHGRRHDFSFDKLLYQGQAGQLAGQGQLSWFNGVQLQGQFNLQDLDNQFWLPTWPAKMTGEAELSLNVSQQHKDIKLNNTNLTGLLKNRPFSFNSISFDLDIQQLLAKELPDFNSQQTQIVWGNNQLALEGGLQADHWQLTVDNQLNDLNELMPTLYGKVNGAVVLQGDQHKPAVITNLWAEKLNYNHKFGVDELSVSGTLPELGNVAGFLQIAAHNLTAANRVIPDLTIVAEGTRENHQITWQMLADPVEAEGILQGAVDNQGNWLGQNTTGTVKINDFLWEQVAPFASEWQMADKKLTLATHCWQAEQAQLCSQQPLILSPQQASAKISLQGLEISRLQHLFPEGLAWQGDLQGQLNFAWQAQHKPQFNLQVLTQNGALGLTQEDEEPLTLPYHQLKLSAKDDENNQVGLRFDMQAPNMGQGYIDARIDPQNQPYQINGAMLLEKVNLAMFKPFFPAIRHLSGEMNLAGGLTGEITKPDFYGEFSLNDGEILAKNAPLDFSHTNIKASIRGKQATINGQLNSGKGLAQLKGDVSWQDTPQFNLNIDGKRLEFAQKPLFKAKVSPNLHLQIKPYVINLKGDALVEDALLNPQNLSDQAVPLSADVRVVDLSAPDRIRVAKAMNQWDINADINLRMGDNVVFNGFGVQSKLTGELKLQEQKQRGMQAIGEIQLDKEAKYEAYGQKLNIRRGQILFAGSIAQPALDIEAIKEVDSKIVGVRVDGRANSPNLSLFADTPMSQDEMLGYLLLGRPLYQDGQLTLVNESATGRNDSTLLASAALSLGIKSGQGLASGIGTALGVKDVTLDAEGTGDDTRFTVSGYLTPSLYLRYGVGVFTPVNKVTLRYKLNKNLYLEAVSSLESALDLFYNFKF
ncbi:MAG: translocation/assembly module TamB domain-containing protein [Agitococcus sp.]